MGTDSIIRQIIIIYYYYYYYYYKWKIHCFKLPAYVPRTAPVGKFTPNEIDILWNKNMWQR